jgi:hypothetical protein
MQSNWKEKVREKLATELNSGDTDSKLESLENRLQSESCSLNNEEKKLLYSCMNKTELNSIGNMALLTRSDNSSNSNGLFDAKRKNIVSLISKGSFVPKHTYDVFSKLLSADMEPDLRVWSEKDIKAHKDYLDKRIKQIKEELAK